MHASQKTTCSLTTRRLPAILHPVIFALLILLAAVARSADDKPPTIRHPKIIQYDRDYDDRIDRRENYDAQGKLKKAETDTNGDGRFDEIVEYQDGVPQRASKDLNADMTADVLLRYDDGGKLVRTENDTDFDGHIDQWVYYVDGVPKRAEKDSNGNGKADIFQTFDESGQLTGQETHYDGSDQGEFLEEKQHNDVLFFHGGKLY